MNDTLLILYMTQSSAPQKLIRFQQLTPGEAVVFLLSLITVLMIVAYMMSKNNDL